MSVKAYELVPLIPRFLSPSGDKGVKIECIECSGKYVFIGTSDGHVVKYVVHETTDVGSSSLSFTYQKEGHHLFDPKKPVRILKAASALEKLLVVWDTNLSVLNLNSLETVGSRLKNVQTICVNENPQVSDPFIVQICVGILSKSQVAVYNVTTDDKLSHVNNLNLPEPARNLSADGKILCAALRTKYVIHDGDQGQVQDLFPYSMETLTPFIMRIGKEEFLLGGPDGLGIYVCSGGTSNRPPLQWSYPLNSLAFHHPYIIGVSNEIIMVHSIVDQQQKQAIPFLGGQIIGNYDGHIYVCSQNELHALIPVPWEKQVDALLLDEHVEEALALLEKVGSTGQSGSEMDSMKKRFKQRAAFIYFAWMELEIALELFLESELDEREVISIFPGLLPASTAFVRAVPPLHSIADVNQLYHSDKKKIFDAKQLLVHYLQMAHDSRKSSHALEIDTALVKLYAELRQTHELESLVKSRNFSGDLQSCLTWLETKNLHNARALVLLHSGKAPEALALWCQMISGVLCEPNFRGIGFFAKVLKNVGDPDLLWQYADIVLDCNEEEGVKLFIQSVPDSGRGVELDLEPNTVANYLQRYPKALILFLEHLINERGNDEEKFHTQLAVQYIDQISKLKAQGARKQELVEDNISRLRNFLKKSDRYRAMFLLPKVRDLNLHQDVAILYGKMGDHDKALRILVKELRDFKAAEEYCFLNGEGEERHSYNPLLHTLLVTYLDPNLSGTDRDEFLVPALELLNKHASRFDPVKAIEILPANLSVSVIESFLRGAVRSSLVKFRETKMEKSLSKADSILKSATLYNMEKHSLRLLETNYCCVCKKPFEDMKFAWYPNDVVTHVECGRLANVCPLTGRCFTLNPVQPR